MTLLDELEAPGTESRRPTYADPNFEKLIVWWQQDCFLEITSNDGPMSLNLANLYFVDDETSPYQKEIIDLYNSVSERCNKAVDQSYEKGTPAIVDGVLIPEAVVEPFVEGGIVLEPRSRCGGFIDFVSVEFQIITTSQIHSFAAIQDSVFIWQDND
ncbi:hypothetical protein [Tateyamaria sp.]|uniref:hypothetical protein n=1 Tax=Tateyamaria sp. TaxID=1929288 RepID=UPI00329E852B